MEGRKEGVVSVRADRSADWRARSGGGAGSALTTAVAGNGGVVDAEMGRAGARTDADIGSIGAERTESRAGRRTHLVVGRTGAEGEKPAAQMGGG